MFHGDDRPLGAAGLNELPPYYSKRLQVAIPTGQDSVRSERRLADADAHAERLFRDFKMGLLTLVVVALLLLAYFWDGDRSASAPGIGDRDDVLSFSLRGARRSEVMPRDRLPVARPVRRLPAPPVTAPRENVSRQPRASVRQASTNALYTVRRGDTLSGIALRFYGNASHWKTILKANRSRLRRPADLLPGMKLVVPKQNRQAGTGAQPSPHLARAGP